MKILQYLWQAHLTGACSDLLNRSIIRTFLASAMLMLFLFSLAPKQWLHDIFAGHVDIAANVPHDGNDHLSTAGYTCDCNSSVVTSPFIEYRENLLLPAEKQYNAFNGSLSASPAIACRFLNILRGPPFPVQSFA